GGHCSGRRCRQGAYERIPGRQGCQGTKVMNSFAQQTSADTAAAPRYRQVTMGGSLEATFTDRPDGSLLVVANEPLRAYPDRITDCLIKGAREHGDRILVARRGPDGNWHEITWAQTLHRARNIAQALLNRGLNVDRPVVILSGNDLEHFQML